jgi:homoserine kinase type II
VAARCALDNTMLERIETAYDLGKVVLVEPISDGAVNSTYVLRTESDDLVLTIFENGKSLAAANELGEFMSLLDAVGIRVPTYRITRGGTHATSLGEHRVLLAQYIAAGRPEGSETTVIECEAVGKALGALHLAQASVRQPITDIPQWRSGAYQFGSAHTVVERAAPDRQRLIHQMQQIAAAIPYDLLPKGLIHTDVFPGNVIFDAEGSPHLIDFDEMAVGPFIVDLCIAVNSFCSRSSAVDRTLRESMIRGYERSRLLTGEEREHLPAVLVAAAFDIYCSRLLNPWMDLPADEYLELAHSHLAAVTG